MADIFNLTDTWNSAPTVFTAVKMNVTDTASDANSLLFDYLVAGASKGKLDKSGNSTFSGTVTTGGNVNCGNNLSLSTAAGTIYFGTGSDASLLRVQAGVLKLNNNIGGSTTPGALVMPPYTVATLPTAAAALAGTRAFVTDANSAVFKAAVAGGGTNKVPVHCDGAGWFIG